MRAITPGPRQESGRSHTFLYAPSLSLPPPGFLSRNSLPVPAAAYGHKRGSLPPHLLGHIQSYAPSLRTFPYISVHFRTFPYFPTLHFPASLRDLQFLMTSYPGPRPGAMIISPLRGLVDSGTEVSTLAQRVTECTAGNGWERMGMNGNGWEWSDSTDGNGWEWMGLDGNGWEWMGTDGNGRIVRMGTDWNGWERMGTAGNGWKRMGTDGNGWELSGTGETPCVGGKLKRFSFQLYSFPSCDRFF